MKRHLKSRNPALNIPRHHEPVATATIISDTPAVDSAVKQTQVLVDRDTLVADAYPLKSGKQFVNTPFPIGILSFITQIRILLNGCTGLSNPRLT